MHCELGHPRGCMASTGMMSSPALNNAAVAQPLRDARAIIWAGIAACVRRSVAPGDLHADTDT